MDYNFYQRLEIIGKDIPYGRVATYGQLAMLCGKPKNARQVGFALRGNKLTNCFPAHRIINGKGFLSGAGAFATPDLQKKMLKRENIAVDADCRVDLRKYQWQPSLDEVKSYYTLFEEQHI